MRQDRDLPGREARMTRPSEASLAEELEELRQSGLYRPLRVIESPQGHRGRDRRPQADQPVVQQLPRPQHPPAPGRRHHRRHPRPRRRQRRGAHHRGHDVDPRGAGAPPGRLQAHRGVPDPAVGLRHQPRHPLLRPRRGRRGHQRRAQPRQHHRRHPPHQGGAADLQAPRHGRPRASPGGGQAVPPQAGGHRRRLLDGRRHRRPSGDRRAGRGAPGDGHG